MPHRDYCPCVAICIGIAVVIIVILITMLVVRRTDTLRTVSLPQVQNTPIPRIIWTYWNNEKLPPLVQKCIQSWREHMPGYDVRVLTPSSVRIVIPELNLKSIKWIDGPARESDILRVHILEKYGGIWSDASIMLYGPYWFTHAFDTHDFVGFYQKRTTTNPLYPNIENWWFATRPHGVFITAWKAAFMAMPNKSIKQRIAHYKKQGVDTQNIGDLHYLYMHVAAQKVLQQILPRDYIQNHMYLMEAEKGPFLYLAKNNWNAEAAAKDMMKNKGKLASMFKLTRYERPYVK